MSFFRRRRGSFERAGHFDDFEDDFPAMGDRGHSGRGYPSQPGFAGGSPYGEDYDTEYRAPYNTERRTPYGASEYPSRSGSGAPRYSDSDPLINGGRRTNWRPDAQEYPHDRGLFADLDHGYTADDLSGGYGQRRNTQAHPAYDDAEFEYREPSQRYTEALALPRVPNPDHIPVTLDPVLRMRTPTLRTASLVGLDLTGKVNHTALLIRALNPLPVTRTMNIVSLVMVTVILVDVHTIVLSHALAHRHMVQATAPSTMNRDITLPVGPIFATRTSSTERLAFQALATMNLGIFPVMAPILGITFLVAALLLIRVPAPGACLRLASKATLTALTFPEPPSTNCRLCQDDRGNRKLKACRHDLKRLFRTAGGFGEILKALKKEKLKFHPDKFAAVPERAREAVQAKATELFQILGELEENIQEMSDLEGRMGGL
ncbi:hypothetical protein NA57DRAFT_71487 [Rhizodiscina lignyota]|uniref:J domain-containing protein n=1 Tax=Rhizodiscina lignyota TaxID=1504668 RepID=A0A9P4IJW5_9PEZI|nr:hypothetical protein NA57DRAFT_71487 [Rhizodiscina lignyota]